MANSNIENLSIKQPKRYDTFMSGKVVDGETNNKVTLNFDSVRVISIKNSNETTFCQFKLSRVQEKMIMDIEDDVISLTTENAGKWFKNKMNVTTVDEYFQSNLVFNKKHKSIFKLRIESSTIVPDSDLITKKVDIQLRVASVRFLKSTFWICYDILEIKESSCSFKDDDDDNISIVNGLEEEYGPDAEELEAIKSSYKSTLQKKITGLKDDLYKYESLLDELSSNCQLSVLDAIENALS
jgi:hypothetical protein